MRDYIDQFISLFHYSVGLAAILILLHLIGFNYKSAVIRMRVSQLLKQDKEQLIKNKALLWYNQLLRATVSSYRPAMLRTIMTIQSCFLLMFLVFFLSKTQNIVFSLSFAILFAICVPIVFLYIRLSRIRANAQANINVAALKLLQSYLKNDRSMYFALKELSQELTGHMKLVFTMFYLRLFEHEEREEAAQVFAYQIGSFAGRNLSLAILRSLDGTDVNSILQDVTEEISKQERNIRKAETKGREAAQLGWLPAIGAPILFILNDQKMMLKSSYPYLLSTSMGVKALSITITAAVIGIVMAVMLANPKKQI
ncbi:hypothetical protein IHV12_19695 [Fictibacillus sp. 7GRE50]|uniref:hypothetical protein n=1 Tax=Fictibacillus sp. 7GRE50 TaxID=2745878 RepID=UPI0018CC8195|nr:hypothetical protein [Fictibacillus sp. 7GRE50]MBH0167152.1 hypothetical protein [Fictibacillus sp. 7GRE50]